MNCLDCSYVYFKDAVVCWNDVSMLSACESGNRCIALFKDKYQAYCTPFTESEFEYIRNGNFDSLNGAILPGLRSFSRLSCPCGDDGEYPATRFDVFLGRVAVADLNGNVEFREVDFSPVLVGENVFGCPPEIGSKVGFFGKLFLRLKDAFNYVGKGAANKFSKFHNANDSRKEDGGKGNDA